jgi:MoaA/NifB/PqqE/SkfB family radical SAM enzyme
MDLTPFTPLKLLRHSDRVEAMLAGEPTYPISVELDLSNTCPHDCPFCSFGTSTSQGYRQQNWVQFPVPRVYTLIDELAGCGVKSVTLTGGGEPLIHKEIVAIIEHLNRSPLQWGLVTNGFLLRGDVLKPIAEGATFVRVSLDAGSDRTHAFTHGLAKGQHQFETILENMSQLRKSADDRLTIGASFCVVDQNFKEIYQAGKRLRDLGANYLEIRPTFPTDWRGDGWVDGLHFVDEARVELEHARLHLETSTFKIIGMIERFDSLRDESKRFSKCRIGPLMTVIGAEGSIWHCCVHRGIPEFRVGEVITEGFKAAWGKVLARNIEDEIDVTKCPRCRYAGYLELLENAYLKDDMHANFV